jgi:hypothetical protein
MPSLLVVASMTVTEVTTRIALVGGLAFVGLVFIVRSLSTNHRQHGSTFGVVNVTESNSASPARSQWLAKRLGLARWFAGQPRSLLSRAVFLATLALVSGLTLGVGLALGLLALLNGMNTGLN